MSAVHKPARLDDAISQFGLECLRPQFEQMTRVKEDPAWHGDASPWDHVKRVYDKLPLIIDTDVLIAAIVHDVGKALTVAPSFQRHEEVGYRLLEQILPSGPSFHRDKIIWLVQHHGDFRDDLQWRQLVQHHDFPDLMRLFYFDSLAMVPPRPEVFARVSTCYAHIGMVSAPRCVAFHLTKRCNLQCSICYSVFAGPTSQAQGELSLAVLERVLGDLRVMSAEQVILFGGEPLTRVDLEEIVGVCAAYGHDTEVVTNGSLLTRQRLTALYESGLRKIAISIDGTEKYHDVVRGEGSYDRAVQGLKLAREFGFRTRINTVVHAQNKDSVRDLVWSLAGVVDVHKLIYYSPLGRGDQLLWMRPDEWRKWCREIAMSVKGSKNETRLIVEQPYRQVSADVCSMVDPVIRFDGNVYPCVLLFTSSHDLGNVNRQRFAEIWRESRKWEQMRQDNADCIGYNHMFTGDLSSRPGESILLRNGAFRLTCPLKTYDVEDIC